MKRRDFERILRAVGFVLGREGGHPVYVRGTEHVALPRGGNDLNRMVCRRILKEINYPHRVPEINYFGVARGA